MLITSSVTLIIPQTKPDNFIEKMLAINKIQFLIDLQHTYTVKTGGATTSFRPLPVMSDHVLFFNAN